MKRSAAPSFLARKVIKKDENTQNPSLESAKEVTSTDSTTEIKNNEDLKVQSSPAICSTTIPKKKPFKSPVLAKPLLTVKAPQGEEDDNDESVLCFEVFWTQKSKKKHKKMNDGIIICKGRSIVLKNIDGKELGKTTSYSRKTIVDLKEGNTIDVGQKDIEIVRPRNIDEYYSGTIFTSSTPDTVKSAPMILKRSKFKQHSTTEPPKVIILTPLFDPKAEGAVILYEAVGHTDHTGKPHCSVVVDPYIGKHLRPHQVEGVKFLFDCTVGIRNSGWFGCILADSMGLGKTLQAITLLHTLLKPGIHGIPVIKKALIVCPSSLVDNWKNEINRWLGVRLKPIIIGGEDNKQNADKISAFGNGSNNKVLIISYDFFRRLVDRFKSISSIDLLLLDEGHKLKSSSSLVTKAIMSMPTKRRVILSGTPIQNDLEEFYVMMDLVNPNVFGSIQQFKQVYEKPILLSRDRNSSKEAKKEGQMRSIELSKRCNMFILRRPSTILIPYLPPKVEQVVFCRLSSLQYSLYKLFLDSKAMTDMSENQCYAFKCIGLISKLCNHPDLIHDKCTEETDEFSDANFPEEYEAGACQPEFSGKMFVLDCLLSQIRREEPNSKVVIVSNYTKTLNVIEVLCKRRNYLFFRLDGSTESSKRMKYVQQFNANYSKEFLFLLSSKAGGVGLNLIGGNRLILFDPNWNPATDEQAMARIWREGQKKPVWIYRFISTGTIEEKIYQRQMTKMALSRSIVDDQLTEKNHFTKDDLKKLFILNNRTDCETHELIQCPCGDDDATYNTPNGGDDDDDDVKPKKQLLKKKNRLLKLEDQDSSLLAGFGANNGWCHYRNATMCSDPILQRLAVSDEIARFGSKQCVLSYIFENKTKPLESWDDRSSSSSSSSTSSSTKRCSNSDFVDGYVEDKPEVDEFEFSDEGDNNNGVIILDDDSGDDNNDNNHNDNNNDDDDDDGDDSNFVNDGDRNIEKRNSTVKKVKTLTMNNDDIEDDDELVELLNFDD